ncbi:MAG: hypothetical protein KDD42_01780 [Bdellovibrionales bacterium]|nr:hypothetical protein [Bdellovibrionales bacterium]
MSRSELDYLSDQRIRAEDILLGSLGFGEEASIVSLEATASGYSGRGAYLDGEEFQFESEDPLSEIEKWAIEIILRELASPVNGMGGKSSLLERRAG